MEPKSEDAGSPAISMWVFMEVLILAGIRLMVKFIAG
jgi:hypothetical protein